MLGYDVGMLGCKDGIVTNKADIEAVEIISK